MSGPTGRGGIQTPPLPNGLNVYLSRFFVLVVGVGWLRCIWLGFGWAAAQLQGLAHKGAVGFGAFEGGMGLAGEGDYLSLKTP